MRRKHTIVVIISGVLFIIFSFIVVFSVIYIYNNHKTDEIEKQSPIFPSVDFIQSWYACWFTQYHWDKYFDLIVSLGFDTVILQTSFSNFNGENIAYYESDKFPCDESYSTTLELMLSSADNHNLNVYVGTYTPEDWWHTDYNDQYIEKVKDLHNTLFEEIYNKYGTHKSFVGWYFSPEIFTNIFGYEKQWIKLLNLVIDGIERYGNSLPLVFSPYRGIGSMPFLSLDNTFNKICKEVNFRIGDVIAPQDGFGSESPDKQSYIIDLYNFQKYCYDAIEGTNLTLWINCELFSTDGVFCSSERMLQQFKLANVFCDKTLCFSFVHYCIKEDDKTLFEDYSRVYKENQDR